MDENVVSKKETFSLCHSSILQTDIQEPWQCKYIQVIFIVIKYKIYIVLKVSHSFLADSFLRYRFPV